MPIEGITFSTTTAPQNYGTQYPNATAEDEAERARFRRIDPQNDKLWRTPLRTGIPSLNTFCVCFEGFLCIKR